MPDGWVIALDSWIVQDGNYADFVRGEQRQFAVEFLAEHVEISDVGVRRADHVGDSGYRIAGEVVFATPAAWAIDCGLLVYHDGAPPTGVSTGAYIECEAWLGIDPFFYFERLNLLSGMPALIYTWTIDRIEMNTTPWVQVGERTFERDPGRSTWADVTATDAWDDDQGRASYLLHCRRGADAPRRVAAPS